MSSKTLYTFAGSVWAAAAELAVAELGYKEGDITVKGVNLLAGENFAVSFLKLNPNGTLPTLESNGEVYTTTKDVISNLVRDAPVKVKTGTSIIDTIHEDQYDPNFALFVSRNEEELAAKAGGLAGVFLSGRQAALEKHSKGSDAEAHKAFYDNKLATNGGLLALVKGQVPAEHKDGFFAKSQAHADSLKSAIFELLPSVLPDSGFLGGEIPGEDDYHVGAWLARIAVTAGAKSSGDALTAFEAAYGTPVPEKVAAYWNAWTARPSWQQVYAGGLH
ncbi:hypothetical protein FB45DRAFT_748030 [Roridomyces roridus]|uniref:GST N-terminal domain-containing protein n=1 Tax=Roridomyces roridus TaxID=1738132 RepID=A0AAD7BU68_9AGAR|nr:hypothetical protein FB45DRAFT_748030 [Roridomyces roridus]